MTRGHLQQRLLLPLILLAGALVAIGFSATKSAHGTNSNLKLEPDTSQKDAQASVSADSDSKPTVSIDGTTVPLPAAGHAKLDLGNNRNVDVTVSGNSLTVNEDHSSNVTGGNGSVHVNVSSSTNNSNSDGSANHSSTFSSTNSFTNVNSNGTASISVHN